MRALRRDALRTRLMCGAGGAGMWGGYVYWELRQAGHDAIVKQLTTKKFKILNNRVRTHATWHILGTELDYYDSNTSVGTADDVER
ncbi:unnamed protein product [Arctia plantaginis]|uniref:Uncharacterized protein n=1 Tax=Arctia plantaginis TaxID=874455 RepID=A0A8S0ZWQ9_ARCPL|nr:unnamed protein product [Arctia plantaginis]CAB3236385.1 unnamed protein product [Arctia plantaginis]